MHLILFSLNFPPKSDPTGRERLDTVCEILKRDCLPCSGVDYIETGRFLILAGSGLPALGIAIGAAKQHGISFRVAAYSEDFEWRYPNVA